MILAVAGGFHACNGYVRRNVTRPLVAIVAVMIDGAPDSAQITAIIPGWPMLAAANGSNR
jgi:hypothetical protein